ncbi:MAG: HPr(Ser) kinase/phosphatase [Anaeromassilibacillus sp.]|nr:HPr(Ser) kinase/phosphatase [Anaeromassilibacillus sp.]MDY3779872.1 HPr(Ser) kinase/phosphatase [Candidatus Limousia pullorum]
MPVEFKVLLTKVVKELSLEPLFLPDDYENIQISSMDVNRPGLALTGYLDFFDKTRIIIFGKTEYSYLARFGSEQQRHVIENLFKLKPPAIIIARNLPEKDEILSTAKLYDIPVLRSPDSTSSLSASLVSFLSVELAPRITRHGVLVEVYGEGCLLIGDSGVGKSETAIELIKRGHRLIADDAVEIRRVSKTSLVGSSPDNIRHFIEVRGVGIINARRIFGMGAVKLTEKINMVINMELWDSTKVYDRMGLENEYMEILGIDVPVLTIPVKPGRNLAIIIEVAAMNNRQKKMGYNGAQELLQSLGMDVTPTEVHKKKIITNWKA